MRNLISHKKGRIDHIQINNIMSSEMGDAIINTDQNIKQVNESAVFGTVLISANSKGKIDKIS